MMTDGSKPVLHLVTKDGDWEAIAAQYPHVDQGAGGGGRSIELYNTMEGMCFANHYPTAGDEILIPRSNQAYDKLIKRLADLVRVMGKEGNGLVAELEAAEIDHQTYRLKLDLAASILTVVATSAQKMGKAASQMNNAQTLSQYYGAREAIEEISRGLKKTLRNKSVDLLLKIGEQFDPGVKVLGDTWGLASKYKKFATIGEQVKVLTSDIPLPNPAEILKVRQKLLLSAADVLLDYLDPSKVADAYMILKYGETAQQTNTRAQIDAAANVKASLAGLKQKIDHYKQEQALVYG